MRSRMGLPILAGVTALAVALAAWVIVDRQASQTLAKPSDALFPGLVDRVNDVAKVEVVTPTETFTVVRHDGGEWTMPSKGDYPVLFETVKQAVVGIASLRPLEARTAAPDRYGKLRVTAPTPDSNAGDGEGNLLRLLGAGDKPIAEVIVGKLKSVPTTAREGWYYVRKPDEAQSWLASGRIEVFETGTAWLDPKTPTIPRKRMYRVSAINQKGEEVLVERELPSQSDFKLLTVPDGRKPKHNSVGNSLGSSLGFMSFEDAGKASEIDFSGGRKVVFQTFDGVIVTVDMAERETGAWWAKFTASYDPEASIAETLPESERETLLDPEAAAEEVQKLNDRFGGWAYRLPEYKAKDFGADLDIVTVPKTQNDS
ncbi:MAG: hypothetical protein RIM84_22775 [Alphaproteobacteria bacterium]